jgi:hypothetical protein
MVASMATVLPGQFSSVNLSGNVSVVDCRFFTHGIIRIPHHTALERSLLVHVCAGSGGAGRSSWSVCKSLLGTNVDN